MSDKESKRFTSKVEITPVNPFEEKGPSRTCSQPATANCGKPTASNVRHVPITTDRPLGSDHFVAPPPSRLAANSSIKTPNHEYQSPQMSRKPPSVHYIPIFVEGSKDPIMPQTVGAEAPAEQKLCSSEWAAPKRQSDVGGSASAPISSAHGVTSAKHEQPVPLGLEKEVPVERAKSAAAAVATATPKSQTRATPPPPPPPPPPPAPSSPPSSSSSSQLPPSAAKCDPLQQVKQVQREVDSLTRRVEQFNGASCTHKEYLYLDEMLTRNLIKLDLIEVAGNEELRTARKNVIKCIQQAIALLESKALINKSNACTEPDADAESSQNAYLSQNNSAAESSRKPTSNAANTAMLNGTSVGEDANRYAKRDENTN